MTFRSIVLAAALALAACGSEPTPSPDAGQVRPDAATESGLDAGAPGPDAAMPPDAAGPPRTLRSQTMLGAGGFFGTTIKDMGKANGKDPMFAVAAPHEEYPNIPEDRPSVGKVYLFKKGTLPTTLADAAEKLEVPDALATLPGPNVGDPPWYPAVGGAFGYGLAASCDLDKDGFADVAVGNHLWNLSLNQTAAGRVIVFWGDASGTFSGARTTTHGLPAAMIARADCIGQTALCADLDGDGFDDLLATGQNAGPSDTGAAAIFKGQAGVRIAAAAGQFLYPKLAVNQQYLGAASLFEDVDGDGVRDLVLGAWGLIRGTAITGPHNGGFAVFKGGTDWSAGPTFQVTTGGMNETQMGVSLAAFTTAGGARWLAAAAPQYDATGGAVLVYRAESTLSQGVPVHVLRAPAGGTKDDYFANGGLAFVPDFAGKDRGALLVGIPQLSVGGEASAGAVAVFPVAANGLAFEETATLLTHPAPKARDTFGDAIEALGDLDGDGLGDFAVGVPSHLEGDDATGDQTGGVVFFF